MTTTNRPTPPATRDERSIPAHELRALRYGHATPTINWNDRPADRSRNGRRIPGSVKHKGMR